MLDGLGANTVTLSALIGRSATDPWSRVDETTAHRYGGPDAGGAGGGGAGRACYGLPARSRPGRGLRNPARRPLHQSQTAAGPCGLCASPGLPHHLGAGVRRAGVFVQGPPIEVEGPAVGVGGLIIYLVPPEIVVLPSPVTIEPPQVHPVEVAAPERAVPESAD